MAQPNIEELSFYAPELAKALHHGAERAVAQQGINPEAIFLRDRQVAARYNVMEVMPYSHRLGATVLHFLTEQFPEVPLARAEHPNWAEQEEARGVYGFLYGSPENNNPGFRDLSPGAQQTLARHALMIINEQAAEADGTAASLSVVPDRDSRQPTIYLTKPAIRPPEEAAPTVEIPRVCSAEPLVLQDDGWHVTLAPDSPTYKLGADRVAEVYSREKTPEATFQTDLSRIFQWALAAEGPKGVIEVAAHGKRAFGKAVLAQLDKIEAEYQEQPDKTDAVLRMRFSRTRRYLQNLGGRKAHRAVVRALMGDPRSSEKADRLPSIRATSELIGLAKSPRPWLRRALWKLRVGEPIPRHKPAVPAEPVEALTIVTTRPTEMPALGIRPVGRNPYPSVADKNRQLVDSRH